MNLVIPLRNQNVSWFQTHHEYAVYFKTLEAEQKKLLCLPGNGIKGSFMSVLIVGYDLKFDVLVLLYNKPNYLKSN